MIYFWILLKNKKGLIPINFDKMAKKIIKKYIYIIIISIIFLIIIINNNIIKYIYI